MSSVISVIGHDAGQATVEAAFAIPVLMVLILLLLQPGIVLYDYIVLQGAAAEGCRLLATSDGAGSVQDDYVRRRLSAIPQMDLFHVHSQGCSYKIDLVGDETSSEVGVEISTKLKPVPLIDIGMSLLGVTDTDGCLTVKAKSTMPTQPDWVWESGGVPEEWVRDL